MYTIVQSLHTLDLRSYICGFPPCNGSEKNIHLVFIIDIRKVPHQQTEDLIRKEHPTTHIMRHLFRIAA